MAYQAHEARQANEPPPKDDTEVMGTTTIKEPEARIDALVWRSAPNGTAEVLHGATVTSAPRVQLDDEAVRRADFRVDDGPVQTDTTAPFQVNDGAPVELAPGAHSVTATVTYDDGRSALHQAFFTVTG